MSWRSRLRQRVPSGASASTTAPSPGGRRGGAGALVQVAPSSAERAIASSVSTTSAPPSSATQRMPPANGRASSCHATAFRLAHGGCLLIEGSLAVQLLHRVLGGLAHLEHGVRGRLLERGARRRIADALERADGDGALVPVVGV